MLKEFNEFENKNTHLLTQYYDKVLSIEQAVDFDINNLIKISDLYTDDVNEKDKIIFFDIISKIESKNIVNKTELSNILIEGEKILALAKAFIDDKKSNNQQYNALKNSLMQNLTSRKEMLESNVERVKSKIFQLNQIIKKFQNQDYDVDKDKVKNLINQEIKNALKSYEIPLKKITKFNEIDTCNTIDCLKNQLKSMNQQIIDQNEVIKKISTLYAEEIDRVKEIINKIRKDIFILKNEVNNTFLKYEQIMKDDNYELKTRIRHIEESLNINEIKKYY